MKATVCRWQIDETISAILGRRRGRGYTNVANLTILADPTRKATTSIDGGKEGHSTLFSAPDWLFGHSLVKQCADHDLPRSGDTCHMLLPLFSQMDTWTVESSVWMWSVQYGASGQMLCCDTWTEVVFYWPRFPYQIKQKLYSLLVKERSHEY